MAECIKKGDKWFCDSSCMSFEWGNFSFKNIVNFSRRISNSRQSEFFFDSLERIK